MVLVIGVVLADLAFFRLATPASVPDPQFIEDDLITNGEAGALLSTAGPVSEIDHEGAYENFSGFVLVEKSSLVGSENALAEEVQPSEDELLTYVVQDGDTLSSIAAEFGLSVGDIKEVNDKGSNLIKPGEELVILPVSEGGELARRTSSNTEANLAQTESYFTRPVKGGWNWGTVHDSGYMPAVDISTACGSSIFAAADGTVIRIGNPDYYNSGYGGYVLISHANGSRTLYAHNSENLVEVGDTVVQGDLIARVGNTGLTYGSTGCHVHFGVTGASNPFAS